MDSASPGSSYSVSTCQVKPSCSERQISEVQSRLVEKDESASFESCQMNSKRKSAVLRQGTDGMDPMLSQSPSNFASVEARFMKGLSDCKDGHDRAGLMGNSCCRNEARIATNISKTEYEMDSLSTVALSSGNLRAARHTQMQAGLAIGNPEEEMTYGLGELQREIDRLTERLAELHLQKKKREEQILRLRQEKCDKIIIPDKRGIERDDKQPRAEIEISTRSACAGHSSGMSQTYKLNNVAQKARALSPADSAVRRAAQTPIKRQRKLSELRRSVSSTARRIERSSSNEQMKVPRRLSMSAALASDSDLKQQQQNFRSMSSKSSQCRVVPSRYGRAITPDACRPPATSSTKKILSKRTDNSFAPASFPSPSASLTCNPSRKASTPRNGYPSRSSVSISTLDRQAKELLYAVSSSDQILPSTLTSPLTKSEHRALATSEDRGLIKAEDSAALTSASLTCSPSRKASTPRNGYPSRSGFSTPANDRRAMELKCSVSSSMQNLPSTLTSQIIKPEDRTRLLQSPRCMSPRPRLDSPKTTAALYKCLESLLEDSKHFFKHLSPRRSRGLFRLGQDSIAASNPSSVSVQGISAKEIVSPRSQFR
ncbi:hypothetical protein KP509_07G039300 [Ceratopteris richardii]|nr:hypothetical protein KP509_07G039300 [Ceratopteris richardii]